MNYIKALTDSDAMGQLVLLIAKTVTLQLDDEELNVDGAEKRKSGGGKVSLHWISSDYKVT